MCVYRCLDQWFFGSTAILCHGRHFVFCIVLFCYFSVVLSFWCGILVLVVLVPVSDRRLVIRGPLLITVDRRRCTGFWAAGSRRVRRLLGRRQRRMHRLCGPPAEGYAPAFGAAGKRGICSPSMGVFGVAAAILLCCPPFDVIFSVGVLYLCAFFFSS